MSAKSHYSPLPAFKEQSPRNLASLIRPVQVSDRLKYAYKYEPVPPNAKSQVLASATPSNNASRSVSTRGHILTTTEKAKQSLLDSLVQIPGVSVRTYGGATLGDRVIRVIVPDILGATANQVRVAEIQTRRQYRNVRLNLEIEEAEAFDTSPPIHLREE